MRSNEREKIEVSRKVGKEEKRKFLWPQTLGSTNKVQFRPVTVASMRRFISSESIQLILFHKSYDIYS